MLTKNTLAILLEIAEKAGEAIMTVYQQGSDVQIENKADDSPVTEADHAAHHVIVDALSQAFPDIPILSEESVAVAVEERLSWDRYWLVDPLDGTKEFIGRSGEFTVNIALMSGAEPVLGCVSVPVTGLAYLGGQGIGAFKVDQGEWIEISTRPLSRAELVVVGSRRHGAEALDKMLDELADAFDSISNTNIGSSLKFCLIAEGKADIYPRLALTSEWDTAAAQAVLSAAGGSVFGLDFKPLAYNKPDTLLNPFFIAVGDKDQGWPELLADAL